MHKSLTARIIGFAGSLILSIAAFFIVFRPDFLHLELKTIIIAIFIFAFIQFIIQSICFLNVLSEKENRWGLIVFISTLSIIFLIIAASIWIMNHLNYNMMMN